MEKQRSNRYKKLFSDTAAFTVSNFASKLLSFLLIPLYTSVLTTEEYGIADLITNTVNVVYPLLTLCIMEATLRFAFDSDVSKEEVLFNSLFVIIIGEAIVIAFTPFIHFINYEMYKYWVWFAIILFGFNLQQVISQYAKGIGKTKLFAVSGVVQTVVIITVNIVGLLVFHLGLFAYLLAVAMGYYVNSLFLILTVPIRIRKPHLNMVLMRDMLKFSIPTIPTVIAWWVSTSADKYIIIAYLGIVSSGIYSVAYKIPSLLTLFTSIFTSAWTISVIDGVDDEDNAEFQSTVYNCFNIMNVFACAILILLSQGLAKVLFSNDFYTAWHYVPILLVAYVFSGLAGFMASSFRAAKYTKGLFSSAVIGAVTNIILNFFFVKVLGVFGAALTTMIGFAVTFYIRSRIIKKVVDLKTNLLKDTFAYILLFLMAMVVSFELQGSYFIGIVIFIALTVLYLKDIRSFFSRVIKTIKRVYRREKRKDTSNDDRT